MTRAELNTDIDNNISNITTENGITPVILGDELKILADYIDEKDLTKPNSDDLGLVAFSNDYNDLDNKPIKTSGSLEIENISPYQVLNYDLNSIVTTGSSDKVVLPDSAPIGKTVYVFAMNNANSFTVRGNQSGSSLISPNGIASQTSSITVAPNTSYLFTSLGSGYWKSEIIIGYVAENGQNKSTNVTTDGASDTKYPTVKAVKTYVDAVSMPYSFWRAEINYNSVVRVLHDGIGFTSPTVTNPYNGVLYITKTGFFTSIDSTKLEFISGNLNNFGSVYVTYADQNGFVNPNNQFQVQIFDMAGLQTGTPNGNVVVEIRIYN